MRLMPAHEAEALTPEGEGHGHGTQGKVVGLSLVLRERKNAA
jgi:hypothetical protein